MRGNCVSSVLSVMVEVKEKNEATEAEERKLQSHWFLVPLWFKEKKKPNPGPKTLWGSSLTQLPWFHMQFSFLLFLSTTFLKPCRPCLLHTYVCVVSLFYWLSVLSVCLCAAITLRKDAFTHSALLWVPLCLRLFMTQCFKAEILSFVLFIPGLSAVFFILISSVWRRFFPTLFSDFLLSSADEFLKNFISRCEIFGYESATQHRRRF